MTHIENAFLEKVIVKSILTDKTFLVLLSSVFEPSYFDDAAAAEIFKLSRAHVEEYKTLPTKDIIINSVDDKLREDTIELFKDIESLDIDIIKDHDYIITETNRYLKEQSVKGAIIDSVNIIDKNGDYEEILSRIENALSKDLKIDLGLNYFEELGARLKRIFTASDVRIPTFLPQFDEYINGGFPAFTLSVIVAKIGKGKSNFIANVASRQVLHGYNVVLMSMEMAQDAFAQRFDSIYSLMDINRMYVSKDKMKELGAKLNVIKKTKGRGNLYIKQFPTGEASVRDFKSYLRELLMRDIKPHILYVDYINLMRPALAKHDNMYSAVKRISEELRALSFEFEVPVISVSQLNREGSFVGFKELDFNYIAESWGIPQTADFVGIFGTDEDALIYENELHYKIVKNRLGGRVGEMDKLYLDTRTLKMYDNTELNMWIFDANISGDRRDIAEKGEGDRT